MNIRDGPSREQTVCRNRIRISWAHRYKLTWMKTVLKGPQSKEMSSARYNLPKRALEKGARWHTELGWQLLKCNLPSFLAVQQITCPSKQAWDWDEPRTCQTCTRCSWRRAKVIPCACPFDHLLNSYKKPDITPNAREVLSSASLRSHSIWLCRRNGYISYIGNMTKRYLLT